MALDIPSNPRRPYVVTVSGATASSQVVIQVEGKGRATVATDSAGRASYDIANLTNAYAVDDRIIVTQLGGVDIGGGSATIAAADKGGARIALTTAAIAFPGASL